MLKFVFHQGSLKLLFQSFIIESVYGVRSVSILSSLFGVYRSDNIFNCSLKYGFECEVICVRGIVRLAVSMIHCSKMPYKRVALQHSSSSSHRD